MSALQEMTDAGFVVEFVPPDQLDIAPASRLSGTQLQWVCDNKTQLMAELQTANDTPTTWQAFVDECTRQGATADEVAAMFRQSDTDDFCAAVSLSTMPLHARTIVDAIKVRRGLEPVQYVNPGYVHVFNGPVTRRCIDCQHFERIAHPHLGTCAASEPEGIAGNWDTDPRNHCPSWQSHVSGEATKPAIAGKKQVSDG